MSRFFLRLKAGQLQVVFLKMRELSEWVGLDQIVSVASGNSAIVREMLDEIGWEKGNYPSDEEIEDMFKNSSDYPL